MDGYYRISVADDIIGETAVRGYLVEYGENYTVGKVERGDIVIASDVVYVELERAVGGCDRIAGDGRLAGDETEV